MSQVTPGRLSSESTLANRQSLLGLAEYARHVLQQPQCDPEHLQPCFAELRSLFSDRMAEEEEGRGVLQETIFEAPYLTAQVQDCLQQLRWLKEQIDMLCERVQHAEDDPAAMPILRVQFDDFFEDLSNYDHGLHSLRFNALCEDDE